VPTIDWDSEQVEPAQRGGEGGQFSVAVRGADAGWAGRFNEIAEGQFTRGEVRGGRWGRVRYHEVEQIITVDDYYGPDEAIRTNLKELADLAGSG
jgi:hypothetical protein